MQGNIIFFKGKAKANTPFLGIKLLTAAKKAFFFINIAVRLKNVYFFKIFLFFKENIVTNSKASKNLKILFNGVARYSQDTLNGLPIFFTFLILNKNQQTIYIICWFFNDFRGFERKTGLEPAT